MNKALLKKQSELYSSFYLYDEKMIVEQIKALNEHFPYVEFLYSIKCNPNPHVLRAVFSRGLGADAASSEEVHKAVMCGLPKDKIYFSAPGKLRMDIYETMGQSITIADSIGEIKRIQISAKKRNIVADIGVRINPDFSFCGGEGSSSKFGIDEDQLYSFIENEDMSNIRINGIHVHLHSQELDADVLSKYHENVFKLAERVESYLHADLEYINFGSGIGIDFALTDKPMDLKKLSDSFKVHYDAYHTSHPVTKIYIETGRFAVGKAGTYVMRVIDRKVSYGKTYIILKNTLNGFLKPSVARMIAHLMGEEPDAMWEPMYTGRDTFQFIPLKDGEPTEKVDLVGCLCTGTDVIAEDIMMPHLAEGDAVAIPNAGAYAAVLSPMQFASLKKPTELFLDVDGNIKI